MTVVFGYANDNKAESYVSDASANTEETIREYQNVLLGFTLKATLGYS